jgi:hypothetical protein
MAVKTFTTGEVLTAADTNTYLNNGGLVYITQSSFSGVASVSINSCFTSTYTSYRLLIQVYGSVATNCQLRLRASGVDASGTDYYDRGYYNNAGTVTALTNSAVSVIFVTNYNTNVGYPGRVSMDVHAPQLAARTVFHTQWQDSFSVLGGDTHSVHATGNSYDGFSLLAASGTITGTVFVYGYRQA